MAFNTFSRTLCISASVIALAASHARAADELPVDKLLNLSLEQLSNVEVTTVSKKAEKANEAAAAVFVITADDIKRIGATSIPEALRIAPGVDVARSGSHDWAVSIRGFNGQFSNKLLVLIDGRSVYTPLFSGVWWDAQDTMLEDIERIEVIRGPGGTLWGANAVNGIINIITKNSKDTQGALASATYGTDGGIAAGRYGAKVGEDSYIRAYAKHNVEGSQDLVSGGSAGDSWNKSQVGFRGDFTPTTKDKVTFQGDIYKIEEDGILNLPSLPGPTTTTDADFSIYGGNVLGRWTRELEDKSNFSVQAFFDNAYRNHGYYKNNINTLDFDVQYSLSPMERHEIIVGTGYRSVWDEVYNTFYYSQTPEHRQDNLFSAFVQDKITLLPNELFLTVGSKFEHNDYTGFEFQPSARMSWLIDDKQMMWGAITRSVRTPSLFTDDGRLVLQSFTVPANGYVVAEPNRNLDSESSFAYELGYRIQPVENVSVDAAAFYNTYSKLFAEELGTPFFLGSGDLEQPLYPYNSNSGRSFGIELTANWEVTHNWRLSGSYSFIDLTFKDPFIGFSFEDTEPEQMFSARSTLLLPYNIEMNNMLYYVDSVPGVDIPDYFRFDTRVSWKAMDGLELSIVGQNLFDSNHPEFNGAIYQNNAQIGRSVYGNITWRF